MYRILVFGILTLIFIVAIHSNVKFSSAADPGQNALFQKRQGFMVYNNTNYGFSLLYPQDWTVIEGDTKPGDYRTDIVTFEPLGEIGKHYSKKYLCGEVCLGIHLTSSQVGDATFQQFSDDVYNSLKSGKGHSKSLEYNPNSKLGGKKAFEMLDEVKQGNREYIEKYTGALYPDPDASESKTVLAIQSKTRDKYSGEMLPMMQTMTDSFKYIQNVNITK